MDNEKNLLKALQNKQSLIMEYYKKIAELESERKDLNAKLKKLKTRFEELLTTDANPKQLVMFENLDEFLLDADDD